MARRGNADLLSTTPAASHDARAAARRPGRLRGAAPPLGLFLLALAVRALPWREVFTRQGVEPAGNDAFFHLRAIAWCVRNFPQTLAHDPYMNFPHGARPIAAPLFDWTVALLALPFAGDLDAGDLRAVEMLAAWVPPVLGAATVVALWAIARRHFGAGSAWLAGLVLAVLSGHFSYSQVGNVDHHVAVALLSTLLLGAGLGLAAARADGRRRRARRSAVLAGGAAGLLFLTWPGGLLHLALLDAGLLGLLLRQRERAGARALAADLAWLHGVALVMVAPWAWGQSWPRWGRFSPAVLSDFQPWLLASAALTLLLARAAWGAPWLGASRPRRALGLGLAGAALGGAGLALLPDLAAGLAQAPQWLLRSDDFALYRQIKEAQPLLFSSGELDATRAASHLSGFVLLFPLALAVLAWRGRQRPACVVLSVWAAGLFGAALLQQRFVDSFSVALAAVSGISVCAVWRALPAARRGAPAAALLASACLVLLWPTLRTYERHLDNQLRYLRGEGAVVIYFATPDLGRWLRDSTPPPGGWLEPGARPAYGVLAPWHVGHLIKYAARRPVVADNFGEDAAPDGVRFAEHVYGATEATALPDLEARHIRYVVGYDLGGFLSRPPGPGSLLNALYLEATPGQLRHEPGFTRLRLVFESPPRNRRAPHDPPVYRVFEVVPGARITGSAPPGSEVEVALELGSNRGRRLRYHTRSRAGEDGRWELRVPYATRGGPPSLEADPHYALACGGRSARLAIDEQQVQGGERVEAPDFCRAPVGEADPGRPG